tara:strand:- start:1474 stop:2832 length:1359 start_codon:yes stop_codon:yes gene_type:complete
MFLGAMQTVNPDYLFGLDAASMGAMAALPGVLMFLLAAFAASVTMGAAKIHSAEKKVRSGYRRTNFGFLVKLMVANPIMPLVMIFGVFFFAFSVFEYFGENNRGVEFFVESEPEQAIVYVKARGNLSLPEKDRILKEAEAIVLAHPGVESVFAFAGAGGLNQNTSGAEKPKDTIAQIQLETIPWENRRDRPELDGNVIMKELIEALEQLPGIQIEVLGIERGPASNKPVHLRLTGDNWPELLSVTQEMRSVFDQTEGLTLVEDTRPLPGIDWQIDVDVEKAGRYGADVATVGAMVQLVTRGILLDTMRVETSDEEIEIRVRLPEKDRVLSTLDGLKLRTRDGLVPLSNFITRKPVQKLAEINRIDQKRYFDIKAGVLPGLSRSETDAAGVEKDILINANERIAFLTRYLEANPLPPGVSWEWTGDQEDEAAVLIKLKPLRFTTCNATVVSPL